MFRLTCFLLLFYVAMFSQMKAQYTKTFNVYFNLNKSELDEVNRNLIKLEIDSLTNSNIQKIKIIGHTDNSADSLYNIKLSDKRTREVKKHLVTLGLNDNIIELDYWGENKPIVKNDNEQKRRLNRRAEVIVYYTNMVGKCSLGDTIIRTKGGKEIVFDGCEFRELKNCIEIIEKSTQNDFKKGIVVFWGNAQNLHNYGRLQVNLLDGCSDSDCFRNPVKIRMPVYGTPNPDNLPWALVKGEKTLLRLVKIKNRLFYEFELKCPTSWINCNCKKNKKY